MKAGPLYLSTVFLFLSCVSTDPGTLENPSPALMSRIEGDLPVFLELALEAQVLGMKSGRLLTPEEKKYAESLPLQNWEEVRIVETDDLRPSEKLREVWRSYGLELGDRSPLGLALHRTVFVLKNLNNQAQVIRHELVHIAQYQRLGFAGYFRRYLLELQYQGYHGVSLEAEAFERMDEDGFGPQ